MTREYRDTTDDAENEGALEEQTERIRAIKGSEALGYKGEAREEHSGQNPPRENPEPKGDLADNEREQVKPE